MANAISMANSLGAEMKRLGLLVKGTGRIRDPEEELEIENRWLRRRVERLERAAGITPSRSSG
jgi:hypothetical protein